MPALNQAILRAAVDVAVGARANALFLPERSAAELDEMALPKSCRVVLMSFGTVAKKSAITYLTMPEVEMARSGEVKIAVALSLSRKIISPTDKVVFVNGLAHGEALDSILVLDMGKEKDLLLHRGVEGIGEGVLPEVFEEVLGIALELAMRGREGKPVGTTFIIGDEKKVLKYSKQMIINPFKGYAPRDRNILSRGLRETIREFAAIDGAFVIGRDGQILTAGCYLGVGADQSKIPSGLGARHIAAASITSVTRAIAMVISESTGSIRIFKNGQLLMELEKQAKIPVIS